MSAIKNEIKLRQMSTLSTLFDVSYNMGCQVLFGRIFKIYFKIAIYLETDHLYTHFYNLLHESVFFF